MQKEMETFAEGCDQELQEVVSNIMMLNKNIETLNLAGHSNNAV